MSKRKALRPTNNRVFLLTAAASTAAPAREAQHGWKRRVWGCKSPSPRPWLPAGSILGCSGPWAPRPADVTGRVVTEASRLTLKGPPRPQEGAVIGRTRQRTRAANLLNSDRGDNNIPPSAVRRPHPPPMPYRQTHADRSLATVPVSPSSPPHFPELGRFSTTRYDIPLAVPLPSAPAVGAPVATRILS